MATFDAPNREVCTVRRGRTNTPLQALVTLNDPVYVEAAQALARRMQEQSNSIQERLVFALRACLIREPSSDEVDRLASLYELALKKYTENADEAKKMAGMIPEEADPAEMAALTVVGNVILNLDEMFMKR